MWSQEKRSILKEADKNGFKNNSLVICISTGNGNIDNNRFGFLWRFDDQADKMFYHLRVKTTG